MDSRCTIYLLGDLRVQQGNRVITRFRTQKTASLLAYLAYYRERRHLRDALVDLFWPEVDLGAGRHSLSMAVSSLRQQLEPPGTPPGRVLVADRGSLGLDPAVVATDVSEFVSAADRACGASGPRTRGALEAAVARYAGELLPGCYDDWIEPERRRLADRCVGLLAALVHEARRAGDLSAAMEYARRAVTLDPYRDSSHAELLCLLRETGRQAEARRHYEELERRYLEDMEVRPPESLRELALGSYTAPGWVRPPGESAPLRGRRSLSIRQPLPRSPAVPDSGRIPRAPTRFFGREDELRRLRRLLDPRSDCPRLVTVLGPGGSGKTRLVQEAARPLCSDYENAVWFVPLEATRAAGDVVGAVLAALGARARPGEEDTVALERELGGRPALLILDNVEQLVPQIGPVVTRLLDRVPLLRLAVTSRRRLGAPEECLEVGPLEVPGEAEAPEIVRRSPSVALFADRARLVRPDFRLTRTNLGSVVRLCRRLEGMPLALELAAAWAHLLSPEQMLQRFPQSLAVPAGRSRDGSSRHRTMRAAIEWSFQLLEPPLQRFFCRLALLEPWWTAGAAEAVTGDEMTLDRLAQLRDASLVAAAGHRLEGGQSEIRFALPEALREFARERLRPEELESLRQRHTAFFRDLAASCCGVSTGSGARADLVRLELEQANLRSALGWGLDRDPAASLPLAQAVARLAEYRGRWHEAREWLCRWLDLYPEAPLGDRAWVLLAGGRLALTASDYRAAEAQLRAAAAAYRAAGQTAGIADALHELGNAAFSRGDYPEAHSRYEECLALRRADGDRENVARTLNTLGTVARLQGDYALSERLHHESLVLAREMGDDRAAAYALHNLGNTAHARGNHLRAREHGRAALALQRRLGDLSGVAMALNNLGTLAYEEGDAAEARGHYEESLALFRQLGSGPGAAFALHGLGSIARDAGQLDAARAYHEESLDLFRVAGVRPGIALALYGLGRLALRRGEIALARTLLRESLELRRQLGDSRDELWSLEALSEVAVGEGDAVLAARLLGEADALREALSCPVPPNERPARERHEMVLRQLLPDGALEREREVGWRRVRARRSV